MNLILLIYISCSQNILETEKNIFYLHNEVECNFLIYMAGDNNLERFGIKNIKELQEIGSSRNCNIFVLFDRSAGYDRTEGDWSNTKLFLISQNPKTMNDDCIFDYEELDMTAMKTLSDFLNLINKYFPARHTILDLWSHGRGVYPDGIIGRSIIEDYTTGYGSDKMMTICDLTDCLTKYKEDTGKKIDIIIFDACYMQMIEICYQLRNVSDYIIGAETTIPGTGNDYKAIATFLRDDYFTMKELVCYIIKSIPLSSIDYSYSAIDTDYLDEFLCSFDSFCEELINTLSVNEILRIRSVLTKVAPVYPEYMDIYEFIINFNDIKGQDEILSLFSKLIISNNSIGIFEEKTIGLGINFPYNDNEIKFYTDSNTNYRGLDFYNNSLFDEFLLKIWQYFE